MINWRYRRWIKILLKRGSTNAYIMFHMVSLGYGGDFIRLDKLINKYRKGGENK